MPSAATLSVIIAALDEERFLPRTLVALASETIDQIIVADGGSTDRTREIAAGHGATVVRSAPGRGLQMNAGAQAAGGDLLLFLHADSIPPPGYPEIIATCLAMPGVAAGAFSLAIDMQGRAIRSIEAAANLRSRLCRSPYGDQGLFLRSGLFRRLGGYPPLPFLEDVEMVRKIRRQGRVVTVRERMLTSGRRWQNHGILQTTLINGLVLFGYRCGIPPARLGAFYRRRQG